MTRRRKSPSPLSASQHRALAWLARHGGQGYLDQHSNVWAQGQKSASAPGTWLRLFIGGYLAPGLIAGTIGITQKGLEALK